MSRYHLSPQATRDFDRIIDELDRRSLTAGNRVTSAMLEQCKRYSLNPEVGILRDDLGKDLRCFLVYLYLVFYRPAGDGIEIVRVFHGHQDIQPDMF